MLITLTVDVEPSADSEYYATPAEVATELAHFLDGQEFRVAVDFHGDQIAKYQVTNVESATTTATTTTTTA